MRVLYISVDLYTAESESIVLNTDPSQLLTYPMLSAFGRGNKLFHLVCCEYNSFEFL